MKLQNGFVTICSRSLRQLLLRNVFSTSLYDTATDKALHQMKSSQTEKKLRSINMSVATKRVLYI